MCVSVTAAHCEGAPLAIYHALRLPSLCWRGTCRVSHLTVQAQREAPFLVACSGRRCDCSVFGGRAGEVLNDRRAESANGFTVGDLLCDGLCGVLCVGLLSSEAAVVGETKASRGHACLTGWGRCGKPDQAAAGAPQAPVAGRLSGAAICCKHTRETVSVTASGCGPAPWLARPRAVRRTSSLDLYGASTLKSLRDTWRTLNRVAAAFC
jgi:hypothetical protein